MADNRDAGQIRSQDSGLTQPCPLAWAACVAVEETSCLWPCPTCPDPIAERIARVMELRGRDRPPRIGPPRLGPAKPTSAPSSKRGRRAPSGTVLAKIAAAACP